MTDKQPEALQLADLLEESYPLEPEAEQSAAELRRQYQEITELKKAKEELREVLFACKVWHNGDAWRTSEDPEARSAWENQRNVIQTTFDKYKD